MSESAIDQVSHNVASHWEAMASHSPHHIGAYGDDRSDFVSAAATTQPHLILPSSRVGSAFVHVSESAVDQVSHNVASHREATVFHSPHHIGAYGDNQLDFVSAAVTTQPHSILPSS